MVLDKKNRLQEEQDRHQDKQDRLQDEYTGCRTSRIVWRKSISG